MNKVGLQLTVEGFMGGSVVLPCSSTQHHFKPQEINVLWRDKDSQHIYDLIEGEDSLETQNPRYKNRAHTFPEEYERGNFSIKLNNLTHDDAGEFNCFITHSSYSKEETVQLIINESTVETGKKSTEEENQVPQSHRITTLLICVCTLLLFIILTSVIYLIYHWRRNTRAAL